MPAFLFDAPSAWDPDRHGSDERSLLGSDQCVIEGEQWFLRGLLAVPVGGWDEDLVYGVWVAVSEGTFERAVELWENERRTFDPPYPGWLASELPGWEPSTVGLLARLKSRPVGKRPVVALHQADHPLPRAVEEGIDAERATALVGLARSIVGG